jgi:1-acyl-sn-glycerol-3-phosphate acyltransferase
MNTVWLVARTLAGYAIILIAGIILFIPCLVIACLPASWRHHNPIYYGCVALFFRIVVWATFLPVTVSGSGSVPDHGAIVVANHQSALDIPFLASIVGHYPHLWLFLKKYTKYPLFGFVARRMNVVVDPTRLRALVGSIEEARKLVAGNGRHILMFPEGGRFTDGEIHHFYLGFALLAKATNRPVIPVYMHNLHKVYAPGSFLLYPYPVTLVVGQPIIMAPDETPEQFAERVRAWFVSTSTSIA